MGQFTHAILYGARIPSDAHLRTGDAGDNTKGLLDVWEDERRGCGRSRDRAFSVEADDEFDVIGFWVAVGGGGIDGVPLLGACVEVSDGAVTEEYRERVAIVRPMWDEFCAWARERGVKFDTERLWLTMTEVT